MIRFVRELRRRNVHRVALAYLAGSWLIVQVLETVLPIYDVDETVIRWVILALLIGFLPALGLSWAFEFSLGGIRSQAEIDSQPGASQSPGRTLDRVVIGILSIALLFFAIDRFLTEPMSTTQGQMARTIAVLPFQDMTEAQDQAFFGDGLAEELLNLLAKNPGLNVVARSSSFSFRNAQMPVKDIARELGVTYLLEGSVRRSGDRIRVTAQLINADNGFHVWSETYDQSLSDIFFIQDQISTRIAAALEAEMLGAIHHERQTDPEAYALYLQANYLARQGGTRTEAQAVALYKKVLAIDPGYAPALANLASVYSNQAAKGNRDRDEGFRLAREAALQAIASEPAYSGGYTQLAWIAQWYDGDLDAAIRYTRRGLELEPADLTMLGHAAVLLLHIGQLQESIAVQEYSATRSPVDPTVFYNLGLAYKYGDRLSDAERSFRTALRLSPDYVGAGYQLGETLLLQGKPAAALAVWEQHAEEPDLTKGRALGAFALHDQQAADDALAKLIRDWGDQWPSEVAHVHAYRGDIDEAFAWLEKEYDKYGAAGWGEWRLQRLYDNLRSDPRWHSFLERVGASAEQLSTYRLDVTVPSLSGPPVAGDEK